MAQLGPLSAQTETLSQVLSLMEAFRAFDSNNDGSITAAELGGLMNSLGYKNIGEAEVSGMMQQGDKNRDGLLSIEEFLELNTKDMGLGNLATSLKEVFQGLDFDEDDVLTGEELFQVVRDNGNGVELSLGVCQDVIASMDGDGDGGVSFEDFKLILSSLL